MHSGRQGIIMGNKRKAMQADLGIFMHILAYPGIFRHVQELFRHNQNLINPGMFRTQLYSKSETKTFRTLSNIYNVACCKNCSQL